MNDLIKVSVLLMAVFLLPFNTHALSQNHEQEYYLGSPYIIAPLGEGNGSAYSSNPLVRYDGFDCTTYVEMFLARQAYAKEVNKTTYGFMYWHNLIRYVDGNISFFSRAHFMEFQWIPNAIKYGFISEYPMKNTIHSNFTINLKSWFLEHPLVTNKDENYIVQSNTKEEEIQESIAYLPREYVDGELIYELPSQMIVFILKEINPKLIHGQKNSAKIDMITHMGLLIDGEFYHASSEQKKVVKENFYDYLMKNTSIKGVALYQVVL